LIEAVLVPAGLRFAPWVSLGNFDQVVLLPVEVIGVYLVFLHLGLVLLVIVAHPLMTRLLLLFPVFEQKREIFF